MKNSIKIIIILLCLSISILGSKEAKTQMNLNGSFVKEAENISNVTGIDSLETTSAEEED